MDNTFVQKPDGSLSFYSMEAMFLHYVEAYGSLSIIAFCSWKLYNTFQTTLKQTSSIPKGSFNVSLEKQLFCTLLIQVRASSYQYNYCLGIYTCTPLYHPVLLCRLVPISAGHFYLEVDTDVLCSHNYSQGSGSNYHSLLRDAVSKKNPEHDR